MLSFLDPEGGGQMLRAQGGLGWRCLGLVAVPGWCVCV